jgi:hypothetical protein
MLPTVEAGGATFLSFAEVARRAEVSSETVRRWVVKKALATSLVKGRQVIAESELVRFLTPQGLEPGKLLQGLTYHEDA